MKFPLIAYLIWDPSREMFSWNLPFLGRPILWYGFLFAAAFFLGYRVLFFFLQREISSKAQTQKIAEQFLLYIGLGAVIGARIGDVLFYQNSSIWLSNPLSILYLWEGGLASHGAAIGCLVGMGFLSRNLQRSFHISFSFWKVFDFVVIPTCLAGSLIRLGNFINQEILGTQTEVPWAVLFLHPADGSLIVPRHPVQLYESIFYSVVFIFLWKVRSFSFFAKEGRLSAVFLVLLFSARFCLEWFKEEQSYWLLGGHFPLTMGQILSIPFICAGLFLLFVFKLKK